FHAQVHRGVGVHDHRQRVVRGVAAGDVGDAHAAEVGVAVETGAFDGVRLEDGEGVESHGGPEVPVEGAQVEMVVIEQRDLFGLHPVDERTDGVAGPHGDAHRDGVDEQPDHRLDAGDLRRPPGDGRPEHHIGAAGERAEHHTPGGLHQGVDGDTAGGGGVVQPYRQGGVEVEVEVL